MYEKGKFMALIKRIFEDFYKFSIKVIFDEVFRFRTNLIEVCKKKRTHHHIG